jgi:hypothetical protein
MIIDAKAIVFTILIVSVGAYFALKVIRAFALQIARENHDAIMALDQTEEQDRKKRVAAADAAEKMAFAKVQPILTNPTGANAI